MRNFKLKLSKTSLIVTLLLACHVTFAQQVALKGTVKDAYSVLQGASVEVVGKNIVAYTNTTGNFEIKLPAGSYTIVVNYGDYAAKKMDVTVAANGTSLQDIVLAGNYEFQKKAMVGSTLGMRKPTETVAAVDIVCQKKLQVPGHIEPSQILNYNEASFHSSRQTLAGGTDHVDPSTLRGLGTSHMLVLVNGQRRHTSSLTNVNNTLGRAETSNDFNSIPLSAIERIEILKDGAVAQYGSDAVAGVINIILKEDVKQTNLKLHVGQQYLGDGLTKAVNANHAMKLGKKGFIDLFADLRFREGTNRSGEYEGTVYTNNVTLDNQLINERRFNRGGNLRLGNAKADNYNLGVNLGFSVCSKVNFTANVLTGYRKSVAGGMYYYPKQTQYVNYFLYPDGFLPLNEAVNRDRSYAAKLNGSTNKMWNWELASVLGENSINYNVSNTNNASQLSAGGAAKTSFYNGRTYYNQSSSTLTFSKDFGKKMNVPTFNFSFGAEWRNENYHIGAGEKDSYSDYAVASLQTGGTTGFVANHANAALKQDRNMIGGFASIESDASKEFLWTASLRYDNYLNDVGSLFAGKVGMRYKVSNNIALRASVSNGYKAPALQQKYFSSIAYVSDATLSGKKIDMIARNESAIANSFGIGKLKAEKSLQFGAGITASNLLGKNLNLTIDAHQIIIDDRIGLTDKFSASTSVPVATLLNSYPTINTVSFITNAAKTTTQSVDVLLYSNENKFWKGLLDVAFGFSYNKTKVNSQNTPNVLNHSGATVTFFSGVEKGRLELAQPVNKGFLTFGYSTGKWMGNARFTYFGGVKTTNNNYALSNGADETFANKVITDASISYKPMPWMTLSFGANNLMNVYPSKLEKAANTMNGLLPYSVNATQFGFNGGYWFTNLAFDLTNIKCVKKPKAAPVAPVTVQKPKDTDGDGVPDTEDKCPTIAGLKYLDGCPDKDGDGIADKDDKCPTVAGVKYLDGCPDKDGDGITDALDKCPTVAGPKVFDGCPDTDGDGIEDAKDKCPNKPGVARYDGCPVPDTDGDGLNDDYDKCPTVAGPIANNGCPEEKKKEVQKKLNEFAAKILFETGSSVIKKSSYKILDEAVAVLKDNEDLNISVDGYTDNVGKPASNMKLSQARANAVKSYLVKKGIKAARVDAMGYGETKPVADNATAEGRLQNRRVEMNVK